ncbi:PREDICTED: pentatricopeptide repeat-containing protein At1g12300, mitochondrial-like [Fragaria vesca subsp. vesca]
MPLLHSSLVLLAVNNYLALFHSKSSNPTKSKHTQYPESVRDPHPPSVPRVSKLRETKIGKRPRVSDVDDALKVFDEMLHSRPLPPVIPFNQILTQLVKFKQYSAVIALSRKIGLIGIAPDYYTLAILINCYCHLNRLLFGLSVLGQFFKLGLQPNVITFNTLINGFVLDNQVQEAARFFNKMRKAGHCKPDVFTFNTLIKGSSKTGNNSAAMQLLSKMEENGYMPDIVSYNTVIDGLCKATLMMKH